MTAWTDDEPAEMIRLSNAGCMASEIAAKLGKTKKAVDYQRTLARQRGLIGDMRKLSYDFDFRLGALFDAGMTDVQIGEQLGATPGSIAYRRKVLGLLRLELSAPTLARKSAGQMKCPHIRMVISHTGEPHTWPLVDGAYTRTITAA